MGGFGVGVGESLTASAVQNGAGFLLRRLLGRRIVISSPRHDELPQDGRPHGKPENNQTSYRVDGRLKRLPKGHEIWLLTQDISTGRVWPQGGGPVSLDERGVWHGRVVLGPPDKRYIVAVVAPPTSADFFRYYFSQAQKTNNWGALSRIPPECRNVARVEVRSV